MSSAIHPIKPLSGARGRSALARASSSATLVERSGSFLPDRLARTRLGLRARGLRARRSIALVAEHCNAVQTMTLERGFLLVRGSLGERYYLAGSYVCRLTLGEMMSYCIHTRDSDADPWEQMLALKMLIETNERRFLRLANPARLLDVEEEKVIVREIVELIRLRRKLDDQSISALGAVIAFHRFANRTTKEEEAA